MTGKRVLIALALVVAGACDGGSDPQPTTSIPTVRTVVAAVVTVPAVLTGADDAEMLTIWLASAEFLTDVGAPERVWFFTGSPGRFTPEELTGIAGASPVPLTFYSDEAQLPGGGYPIPQGDLGLSFSTPGRRPVPGIVEGEIWLFHSDEAGTATNVFFRYTRDGRWELADGVELGLPITTAVS